MPTSRSRQVALRIVEDDVISVEQMNEARVISLFYKKIGGNLKKPP